MHLALAETMSITEIILIRHGESEGNRQKRWQGHWDSPLSERGRLQAQALAARLARLPFDFLYSSDLSRARETAEIVAAATGHALIVEPRLRERNIGIFQGLTWEEIEARHPEEARRLQENWNEYQVPGGESEALFFERAVTTVEKLAQRHRGRRIVAVTHGGVLRAMLMRGLGLPREEARSYAVINAALNRFAYNDEGWELISWGEAEHLT